VSETMTRLEKVLSEVRCRGHATEDEAFDLAGLIRDERADNAALLREVERLKAVPLRWEVCGPSGALLIRAAVEGDARAIVDLRTSTEKLVVVDRAKPSDGEGATGEPV